MSPTEPTMAEHAHQFYWWPGGSQSRASSQAFLSPVCSGTCAFFWDCIFHPLGGEIHNSKKMHKSGKMPGRAEFRHLRKMQPQKKMHKSGSLLRSSQQSSPPVNPCTHSFHLAMAEILSIQIKGVMSMQL